MKKLNLWRSFRFFVVLLLCAALLAPLQAATAGAAHTDTLKSEDIRYLGAFRLPENGEGTEQSFSWSGEGLAFSETGDDGQGSLYVVGHNWHTHVAEVSIPQPLLSRVVEGLPQARVLQPFTNIWGHLFDRWTLEMTRVGLEVLGGDLYFCIGSHLEESAAWGTHGFRSLNLLEPAPQAVCRIRTEDWAYATNDYLFSIPPAWTAAHLPGYDLASGRFRDGGWSGMGPAVFAMRSHDVREASMDEQIPAVPLILYSTDFDNPQAAKLDGYAEADHFAGAAWVDTPAGAALIFAGTHGFGHSWYGFANGVVFTTLDADGNEVHHEPTDPAYSQRGWWNDDFRPVLMLYNPMDLARSAKGELAPSAVQPYATLDLSEYMRHERVDTDQILLGDIAHDRVRGLLYVMELMAEGDKPVIHVFQLGE